MTQFIEGLSEFENNMKILAIGYFRFKLQLFNLNNLFFVLLEEL